MKKTIALMTMIVAGMAWAADDLQFSLGFKYWGGDFETRLDDPMGARTESGGGALAGLSGALTKDRWTFALSYMQDIQEYDVIETDLFTTQFSKVDVDFNVLYAFHTYFGANVGFKRVETELNTSFDIAGVDDFQSKIDMNGLLGGVFGVFPIEQIESVIFAGIGYGFLSTSDLELSDGTSLGTDDADGITWEVSWNFVLSRFVFTVGYKFQDFDYDVDRGDGTTYSTQDLTEGFVLGARYIF